MRLKSLLIAMICMILVTNTLHVIAQNDDTYTHPTTGATLTLEVPSTWRVDFLPSGDFLFATEDGFYQFIVIPELAIETIQAEFGLAEDATYLDILEAAAADAASDTTINALTETTVNAVTFYELETAAPLSVMDDNGVAREVTLITALGFAVFPDDQVLSYGTNAVLDLLPEPYVDLHTAMLDRFSEARFAPLAAVEVPEGLAQYTSDSGAFTVIIPDTWDALAYESPDQLEVEISDDNSGQYFMQLTLVADNFRETLGLEATATLAEVLEVVGSVLVEDAISDDTTVNGLSPVITVELGANTYAYFSASTTEGDYHKAIAFGLLELPDGSAFFVLADLRDVADLSIFEETHATGKAILSTVTFNRDMFEVME